MRGILPFSLRSDWTRQDLATVLAVAEVRARRLGRAAYVAKFCGALQGCSDLAQEARRNARQFFVFRGARSSVSLLVVCFYIRQ